MQPEHIHNHLRLCLRSHRFYELTGARYAAKASLSPSKPFRPQNPQVGNSKSQINSDLESDLIFEVCERAEFG